jgi:hypothetical protein
MQLEDITKLLAKGKIEEAFEQLKVLIKSSQYRKELSLLIIRFEANETEYNVANTVSREDYKLELNRIIRATLLLAEKGIEFPKEAKKSDVDNKIFDIPVKDDNLTNALNIYIDRGEYTSARIVLLSRYGSFYDLPLILKLKLIEIEQKYGLFEHARGHIDYILDRIDQIEDSNKAFKVKVMDLRLASQERRSEKLIRIYSPLLEEAELLNELPFKCTILNRVGVAFAVLKNNQKSRELFEESKKNAIELNLDHSWITAHCLHAMCALIKNVPFDGDPLAELIKAQYEYLEKETDRNIWQGNAFKSSVQCLFSEASYYLLTGQKK